MEGLEALVKIGGIFSAAFVVYGLRDQYKQIKSYMAAPEETRTIQNPNTQKKIILKEH